MCVYLRLRPQFGIFNGRWQNSTHPPSRFVSECRRYIYHTPSGKTQFPLPNILRVRRDKIREALEWLKQHNPLYGDIVISEERLQMLLEDGVPDEILSTVKYSTDMEAVIREHEGYVPSDVVDENQSKHLLTYFIMPFLVMTLFLKGHEDYTEVGQESE